MNDKRAKLLRRLAREINPYATQYEFRIHTNPISLDQSLQVLVSTNCFRGVYLKLKREHTRA